MDRLPQAGLKLPLYLLTKVLLEGTELNVGDTIIDALKTNNTIGWQFVASSDEAIEGVYNGEYYAALVVPENFSKNLISFLSDSMEHPQLKYYCNQKANAIAPKITDKAKQQFSSR